nr:hypothetical protein [uncultured Romboutsia sp.]
MFNKLLKIRRRKQLKLYVDTIKQKKEKYLLEEFMVDKKGNDVYFIVTCDKESGLGIVDIFTDTKNLEKVIFIITEEKLYISDIQIFKNKNKGIGSKVISILERIAIDNEIYLIEGELDSEDEEHRKRQVHFYSKNGFTINDNLLEKIIKY